MPKATYNVDPIDQVLCQIYFYDKGVMNSLARLSENSKLYILKLEECVKDYRGVTKDLVKKLDFDKHVEEHLLTLEDKIAKSNVTHPMRSQIADRIDGYKFLSGVL